MNEIVFAIIFVAITLFVAYVAIKIVQKIVKKAVEKRDFNPDMKYLAYMGVSWVGWFLVVLWLLGEFGQQELVVAMLASGGIIGFAIALSAKDSLAGIFGGLFLLQDKDFSVGDKIKTGSVEGRIIEIGMRKTRISLPNGVIEIVPNCKIDNGGWTLFPREKHRKGPFLKLEGRAKKDFLEKKK